MAEYLLDFSGEDEEELFFFLALSIRAAEIESDRKEEGESWGKPLEALRRKVAVS